MLDAFLFLHMLMKGQTLDDAAAAIRGGEDCIIRKGQTWFELGLTIEHGKLEYEYEINVKKDNIGLMFVQNIIYVSTKGKENKEFNDIDMAQDLPTHIMLVCEKDIVVPDAQEMISIVRETLKSVFVLNPNPMAMRSYSKLSKDLKSDAGNIAGVLAAMKPEEKELLEDKLTKYVKPQPERDINKITAVTVGLSATNAMLYCYED